MKENIMALETQFSHIIENYAVESSKAFGDADTNKTNKSAMRRSRKHLMELSKLIKVMRKTILVAQKAK